MAKPHRDIKVVDYKAVAEFLYDILDDIDSASDLAKGNSVIYENTVERLHKYKNEVGHSPDGQIVIFNTPPNEYGFTRLL
jgi:hypothetical protein